MRRLANRLDRWLWYSVRRRGLDRDLDRCRAVMRGHVLEIGAGRGGRRGSFRPPVEQATFWWTMDVSAQRQPHVLADIQALPLPAGSVDSVVCLEVLEYVDVPLNALSEVRRVLAANGMLVLSVPFMHRADAPEDRWRWTEHGLSVLLRGAGFKVTALHAQAAALGVAADILRYVIFARKPGWLRRLMALGAYPVLMAMRNLDEPLARRLPGLRAFSTGYLLVARVAD